MGCATCGNRDNNNLPAGCKNNGNCGIGSCDKLPAFNWLANMEPSTARSDYKFIEARFKNTRKAFYENDKKLDLQVGQPVMVEAQSGYDIGVVSLIGELARIRKEKGSNTKSKEGVNKVLRKPTETDIKRWVEARKREKETMIRARQIALALGLEMKITDVEFQGDGTKATFYYTADERVDFRTLIVKLAEAFRIKVEMRQIGARQEAGRVGGIGSCGRELCCSSWLTDFRTVQTSAARYQQLAINPQKLAGQCGKLKCCLNYELDMYLEAIREFPNSDTKLLTQKGVANLFKMDLFKKVIWFVYQDDQSGSPVEVPLKRVKEILNLNKKGKKPDSLVLSNDVSTSPDYSNVLSEDSLTRFDSKKKKKRHSRKKRRKKKTTK